MLPESSLTAPEDRDLEDKWRPQQHEPELNPTQLAAAMDELNVTSFTDKFPRVDRTYADPPIPLQNISLVSWIPAKGATPNSSGVYGFAKIRGSYNTGIEADQRAEYLIKNVDSYHQVFHCYTGRPFPLTNSSKYSAETSEVDIRKETTEAVSSDVKAKKLEEEKEMRDIKEREEALIESSKTEEVDPYDEYITLKVKKAQLSWTYLEHVKKIREIKDILIKTKEEIETMDSKDPEFEKKYYEKYMTARRNTGLSESVEDADSSFMKFLVEDATLPGLDEDLFIPKVVPNFVPEVVPDGIVE